MDKNLMFYAIIYHSILFLFLLIALAVWITNRRIARIYWIYGKNIAAVFIFFEIIVFLAKKLDAKILFTIVPLNFIIISVFMTAGMILSKKLNLPSIPLLRSITRGRKDVKNISFIGLIISVILGSAFVCLFTAGLFLVTRPGLSVFMQETVIQGESTTPADIGKSTLLFFILIAVYEEIIFRQFIQRFLSWVLRGIKGGWLLSILLTAALFALGHVGILSTLWVKLTQTFVIGLTLGCIMRKYGLEASIFVHAVLNIFALYASGYLLG